MSAIRTYLGGRSSRWAGRNLGSRTRGARARIALVSPIYVERDPEESQAETFERFVRPVYERREHEGGRDDDVDDGNPG